MLNVKFKLSYVKYTLSADSGDVSVRSQVHLQPLVFRRGCAPGPNSFSFEIVSEIHSCIASTAVPSGT